MNAYLSNPQNQVQYLFLKNSLLVLTNFSLRILCNHGQNYWQFFVIEEISTSFCSVIHNYFQCFSRKTILKLFRKSL